MIGIASVLVSMFVIAAVVFGHRLWQRRSEAEHAPWTRGDTFDVAGLVLALVSLVTTLAISREEAADPGGGTPGSTLAGDAAGDGEAPEPGVELQISGQTSRWLDVDVPAGQPPVDASEPTEGTDLELNLDGTIVAGKATRGGAIALLGLDRPPARPCSEATGWTAESVDPAASPYFCLRTSNDSYVLFHLVAFAENERSPRAVFEVHPG